MLYLSLLAEELLHDRRIGSLGRHARVIYSLNNWWGVQFDNLFKQFVLVMCTLLKVIGTLFLQSYWAHASLL